MTYASFTARLPSMTAVVAASLLAVAPMPSLADKATVCHDYAVTAAKLSQEAINLGCGFNPPVWSTDSSMHFKWCMHGNNSVSAPPQNVKRSADLQTCAAQKSAQTAPALAVCAIYATEATALSVRAQKL
ncbi:MAG TPA: hypothetical protein ENK83_07075, partial [Aliiroseovarius sp.]|nr:hypothetical protein [Aliiroseovarius sp.]